MCREELPESAYERTRQFEMRDSHCWVFRVTESHDLESYQFDSLEEAREFVDSTDDKCQILHTFYDGCGVFISKIEDHT